MSEKAWAVYLPGAVHSDWRERIARGVEAAGRAVARDPARVVQALADVTRGELPRWGAGALARHLRRHSERWSDIRWRGKLVSES